MHLHRVYVFDLYSNLIAGQENAKYLACVSGVSDVSGTLKLAWLPQSAFTRMMVMDDEGRLMQGDFAKARTRVGPAY